MPAALFIRLEKHLTYCYWLPKGWNNLHGFGFSIQIPKDSGAPAVPVICMSSQFSGYLQCETVRQLQILSWMP